MIAVFADIAYSDTSRWTSFLPRLEACALDGFRAKRLPRHGTCQTRSGRLARYLRLGSGRPLTVGQFSFA